MEHLGLAPCVTGYSRFGEFLKIGLLTYYQLHAEKIDHFTISHFNTIMHVTVIII